jgi:hypothetical protein
VRCGLFAIVIFFAALFQLQASPVAPLELPFQYHDGLLWVQVSVPQSAEPLNFLLDTGAGASVINLNTANRIGLKPGTAIAVRGVQATLTGYRLESVSAKAGDVPLPASYLAVDLEKLGHACNCCVDGLIGMDFFRNKIVQIDFAAQKVRLLKSAAAEKSDDSLPVQFRPGGMCVPVRVNGHRNQWVRLDTGCASAFQWVTSQVRPEAAPRQTAIGLAAISIPQTHTTVCLGTQKFYKVPTGLHDEPIFAGESGLLGNGLLSQFSTVTIDAKSERVFLQKRSSSPTF